MKTEKCRMARVLLSIRLAEYSLCETVGKKCSCVKIINHVWVDTAARFGTWGYYLPVTLGCLVDFVYSLVHCTVLHLETNDVSSIASKKIFLSFKKAKSSSCHDVYITYLFIDAPVVFKQLHTVSLIKRLPKLILHSHSMSE